MGEGFRVRAQKWDAPNHASSWLDRRLAKEFQAADDSSGYFFERLIWINPAEYELNITEAESTEQQNLSNRIHKIQAIKQSIDSEKFIIR